eukprot:UN13942
METYLYKVYTKVQRERAESKVDNLGPFSVMVQHSFWRLIGVPRKCPIKKVYRGAVMTTEQINEYRTATESCKLPCTSSTSTDKNVALQFARVGDKKDKNKT